jgi:hypothetical protein
MVGSMLPLSADTPPEVEGLLIAGYRRMTAAEKLKRVQALNETALQFAAARVRRDRPGISERELRLRLASLWLDRATMIRAFGWDPEQHGR